VYEGALQDLIDELGRLPGVGPKSAQRIAFYLLAADQVDVKRLAASLIRVKDEVRFCATCFNVVRLRPRPDVPCLSFSIAYCAAFSNG